MKLVLRADGGSEMGLGHLARVAAIAEMIGCGEALTFYTRCRIPALTTMLASHGQVVALDHARALRDEAVDLAKELTGHETVVLDGEQFDAEYQATLQHRGCSVVCIDDRAVRRFSADLIVNHAAGACVRDYGDVGHTRLCVGAQYAMLRAPFLAAARNAAIREANEHVFVCLGGADPDNRLADVLTSAAHQFPNHRFHIVVGAAYRHAAWLDDVVRDRSVAATVHRDVSAPEICALMQSCSTAITSASTVAMEYACVGGALHVTQTAADQTMVRRGLVDGGMAVDFGAPIDAVAREAMITAQRRTFDGQSDVRLRDAFASVRKSPTC